MWDTRVCPRLGQFWRGHEGPDYDFVLKLAVFVSGLKETGAECSDTLCQYLAEWLMELLRGREILRRVELENLEELLRRQDTIVLVRMLRVTRIVEVRLAAAEQVVVGELVCENRDRPPLMGTDHL